MTVLPDDVAAGTAERKPLPAAGLWDARVSPWGPLLTPEEMRPGAHVIAVANPHEVDVVSIALRRAGFEVRDTLAWLRADGHLLAILARVPVIGTTVDNVVEYSAGALNIDATRIALGDADKAFSEAKNAHQKFGSAPRENHVYGQDSRQQVDWSGDQGRFPTNVLLQHAASCNPIGTTTLSSTATDVRVYDCQDGCPIGVIDAQSDGKPFKDTDQMVGSLPVLFGVGGPSRYFNRFDSDAEVWRWFEKLLAPPGEHVSIDPNITV